MVHSSGNSRNEHAVVLVGIFHPGSSHPWLAFVVRVFFWISPSRNGTDVTPDEHADGLWCAHGVCARIRRQLHLQWYEYGTRCLTATPPPIFTAGRSAHGAEAYFSGQRCAAHFRFFARKGSWSPFFRHFFVSFEFSRGLNLQPLPLLINIPPIPEMVKHIAFIVV